MLSQKTRYALKALMLLAEDELHGKTPVLISSLAQRGNIPQKFLEAIMLELKNHGLLQSKKGKGGGYTLGKSMEELKLGTVIRIMEGPLALLPCVSQMAHQKCDECADENTCGLKVIFKEVRDSTASILDNTSLSRVLGIERQIRESQAEVYFI